MRRIQLLVFNLLVPLLSFVPLLPLSAQDINEDMEKFQMGENMALITSVAMSPDQQTIAAGLHQGFPIHIYDWNNHSVIKKIDVKGYYAGPRVGYSNNGKYLILQQQFYTDWNANRDKPVNYMIVDIEAGRMLYEADNLHFAQISGDSRYFITLADNEIVFYNIGNKSEIKRFKMNELCNAFALSPDGSKIAVAHYPHKEDLENVPSMRNDKKAMKPALKYREMISIYDANTFRKLVTVNEIYDVVYQMKYVNNGDYILVYSKPHKKIQVSAGNAQGYVNVIHASTNASMRNSFVSVSAMEPDIKMSPDGKLIGIISTDGKMNPTLNIYDFNSSKMLYSFDRRTRISTAVREKEASGFWSFVFLPDNKRVLVSSGNRLIIWGLR